MVTPDEILKKATAKYGVFLANDFATNPSDFFPLQIRCDKSMNFTSLKELEKGISQLQFASTEKCRYGYDINFTERNTKQFGIQNVPTMISFKDETNYLKFIGKEKETAVFRTLTHTTLKEFPQLQETLLKHHATVVQYANDWENILRVCRYFQQHPQPHRFVRELNIGVHTKFVEEHTKILRPLLDVVVGDEMVNKEATSFFGHFNLKEGDPEVMIRILDKDLSYQHFSGLSYITAFVYDIAKLQLPLQRVFIVENKCNLESFNEMQDTVVIWGKGYNVTVLKDVEWLHNVPIYYWGDIDAQGYEILSNFRLHFPSTQSIMMDKEAMENHPVRVEGVASQVETTLQLTPEENEVYQLVKRENWRFEQELLPYDFIRQKLMHV